MSFEAEVARILGEVANDLEVQSAGVDFVVVVGPQALRVGVEAKDYRRTPKAHTVDAAAQLLGRAIADGAIVRGLVVAPRDVFIPLSVIARRMVSN